QAESVQLAQHRKRSRRIRHHSGLGELEGQQLGRNVELTQRPSHPFGELFVREVTNRQVHSRRNPEALVQPGPYPTQRLLQHEVREYPDEPGSFDCGNELVRVELSELGMLPAHQRLDTPNLPARQCHLRLVVYRDVAVLDGLPELRDHLEASQEDLPHAGYITTYPLATLGRADRDIGTLQHAVDIDVLGVLLDR